MTGEATFALHGLTKSFGAVEAVRDVSLRAQAGACVALVGHNGAGKTTLMKLMLGLLRPSAGRLEVLGRDPGGASFSTRRQIGFLPENVAFQPAFSGIELLRFYARLKAEPAGEIDRLLTAVGLTDAARRRIGTYSKGMRQRLGLAQALLGNPKLLLLDEPTTGLDPEFRRSFYGLVRQLAAAGSTVLISSHALSELEDVADRVVIMHRGRVLANGSLDELRRLARLPLRMRFTLAGGTTAAPSWLRAEGRPLTANGYELSCPPESKMAVMRRALESEDTIADVEVYAPSLDQLYAHFLHQEGGAP